MTSSMKKKVLVLAVAGAFAAPAAVLAQGKAEAESTPHDALHKGRESGSVTIYGTLNVDYELVKREGATAAGVPLNSLVPAGTGVNSARRDRVSSNSSNIGFRGTEDLGGGLKAVWQIESAIAMDGGTSTLAGRDTYAGLTGNWGTLLFAGNHDSPYKRAVQGKDPFYATGVATQKGILGSPGFNVASVNAVSGITVGGNTGAPPGAAVVQNAGFDARLNNMVFYRSPVFNGFSGEIAYGAREQKTPTLKPSVVSLQVRYEQGPYFLTYAYERRDDVFGLNSIVTGTVPTAGSSEDTANKVGAGYRWDGRWGSTEFLAVWENLDYETSVPASGVTAFDRDAWVVSATHRFANHRVSVSYSDADEGSCTLATGGPCSTSGLGAKQYALGYAYSFSKRTDGYLHWTKIKNDAAASYNFGVTGAPAAGPGADPQAIALGLRHRF